MVYEFLAEKTFIPKNFLETDPSSFLKGLKSDHGELINAVILLSRFYLKMLEVFLSIYLVCQKAF